MVREPTRDWHCPELDESAITMLTQPFSYSVSSKVGCKAASGAATKENMCGRPKAFLLPKVIKHEAEDALATEVESGVLILHWCEPIACKRGTVTVRDKHMVEIGEGRVL
jgi:hypothetical protein